MTTGVYRLSPMRRNEELAGWLFASPWILGFLLFTAGPMLISAGFAFAEYNLLQPAQWVGTANIEKALSGDPLVWQSLKVTTIYAFVSVPLQIVFGLIIALLLNTNIRGLQYYRTIYYLPSVLSGVAVALLRRWIRAELWAINALPVSVSRVLAGSAMHAGRCPRDGMSLARRRRHRHLPGRSARRPHGNLRSRRGRRRRLAPPWNVTILITPVLFYQLIIGIITALQVSPKP